MVNAFKLNLLNYWTSVGKWTNMMIAQTQLLWIIIFECNLDKDQNDLVSSTSQTFHIECLFVTFISMQKVLYFCLTPL